MLKFLSLFVLLTHLLNGFSQKDIYLKNETYTFTEVKKIFQKLASDFPKKSAYDEFGISDFGIPIPVFIMSADGKFTKEAVQSKNVILINNAIHPGEPCGVDACV